MEERSLPIRSPSALPGRPSDQNNLADILERVLDKGIVIAGDIQINLLDIELLTIKLRLLIASVDRAREMGINWWESDPSLQSIGPGGDSDRDRLEQENRELHERLERLERQLDSHLRRERLERLARQQVGLTCDVLKTEEGARLLLTLPLGGRRSLRVVLGAQARFLLSDGDDVAELAAPDPRLDRAVYLLLAELTA